MSATQGKAEPSYEHLVLPCSSPAASLPVKIPRSLFLYIGKTDFCFSLQKRADKQLRLTREFIDDVISVISLYYFIDVFLCIQQKERYTVA